MMGAAKFQHMRSGNPVLPESTFNDVARRGYSQPMTLSGVVHRSVVLLLLVAATAAGIWTYSNSHPSIVYPAVMAGALGGFIVGIVTSLKRSWAVVTAPLYALLEGLFIGGFSLAMEQRFPGLVLQAVLLTFGVMFALLGAYQSRIIRPSQTFKSVIVGATLGIAVVYLASMVLQLFFHTAIPLIHENSPIGIAFSLVVVAIASLNLVLDFDFIENGVAYGAPKWMEWYAAFGLTVTLVWLYIEILRLLAKLRRD
jgi:uncharacterized YccA/Bax inhibitor family protein